MIFRNSKNDMRSIEINIKFRRNEIVFLKNGEIRAAYFGRESRMREQCIFLG